ncbi:WD-repeat protein [Cryptococcus bacillisporus CA1873]|uniref:WD-repeat protein n=1 Tax=Cryptococcus bacillisporus CA1873 TaxID=1296111 RepID=A0ABR5BHQ4_CRYGA|nr:WD-repeat protein [Cryptococcus bacillisporus CA1873]|eukprot:KIR68704.1 WD-repeat protein [Cryptococcus gattii CA1873]
MYSGSARRRPTSPHPLLSIPASHLISSRPYPRFRLSNRLSTMELYMYTPPVYMAPIRPLVKPAPSVPIVKEGPIPELFQAPEGEYNLADPGSVFPVLGNTSPNIASELRLAAQPGPFLGGPGFGLPPTPQQTSPSAASASSTSFGATLINGKWEPIYPTRMSWVMVQFPSKIGDRGFGGLLGKSGKSDTAAFLPPAAADGRYPTKSSYSSSSSSSSPVPSEPQSVPFAMSPPTTQSKWPFAKTINGIPRPKTSMRNSTSDFVQRVIGLDSASKYLAEKGKTVSEVVKWGCWHMGKQWAWADFGKQANETDKKSKETLVKVLFSTPLTCTAIINQTAGVDRLDAIIGFETGDLVWLDPIIGRYTRLNKNGVLNSSRVVGIYPDPRQPTHFLALFADYTILRFNISLEDPLNAANITSRPWDVFFDRVLLATTNGPDPSLSGDRGAGRYLDREQGVELLKWKNEDWVAGVEIEKSKDKNAIVFTGRNPVAALKIGSAQIKALAYSPDGGKLAAVSSDGLLRVIDTSEERITDTFSGYYGALNCVVWSPDSRLIAAGGEDDFVTLFSTGRDARPIARCQGHSSYVTCIAFDPQSNNPSSRAYRFVSVGEDGKLLFWDYSPAAVHKPRQHHPNNSVQRDAAASSMTVNIIDHSRSHTPAERTSGRFHAAPSRKSVPTLQPIMSKTVDVTILTGVYCLPDAIATVSRQGVARFWMRPSSRPST